MQVNAAVELSDSQKQIAEFYFYRIRLFWNMAIENCQEYFNQYMDAPNTAQSDQRLSDALNMFYNTVRFTDFDKESIPLTKSERIKIEQIRELQNTVLRNRLSDIYRIYIRAKTLKLKNYENCGIPKTKDCHDQQSIRFDPSDYIVTADTITITGTTPLIFHIPQLSRIDFSTPKAVTLNFSPKKRRLGAMLSRPKKVPFYYLTFSDAFR